MTMVEFFLWAALAVSVHACYTILQRRQAARVRLVRLPVVKHQVVDRTSVARRHNTQSWD
jgi:hypothetical protein